MPVPRFTSHSLWSIRGCKCFSVTNPYRIDREELGKRYKNKVVVIDDKDYVIQGVESFSIPSIGKGMPIGLLTTEES